MKAIPYIALFISIQISTLSAQSIRLPWQVIDNGGSKSSASGILMQGSVGQAGVAAMTSGGTTLETGYIPGLRNLSGTTATLEVAAEAGWNMISVPFAVSDFRKSVLYGAGTSNAFSYQGSYLIKDTLQNAAGYWIKFSGPMINHFTGSILVSDTIHVADKWNMIGCLSYPMLISSIVPLDSTTTVSKYWGYASGSGYFVEDTLKPGKAYWIKVHNAGRMVLKTGSVMMQPSAAAKAREQRQTDSHSDVNLLTITDAAGNKRSLYVGATAATTDTSEWELPPPLDGVMDVRFGTNRMLESADPSRGKDVGIDISSAEYPLTITWNVKDQAAGMKLTIGGKAIEMKSSGQAQIPNANSHTRLLLSASSGIDLPKQFALYQNFPNPFNPTTTLRYDLPLQSHVRIMVYDALGRQVKELIDGDQNAGYQSIQWNSTNRSGNVVASGIYFYRIEATSLSDPAKTFTQVKKMLLIK